MLKSIRATVDSWEKH